MNYVDYCGGLFASMGQNLFCYTKACELTGKGIETSLVGLYYKLGMPNA